MNLLNRIILTNGVGTLTSKGESNALDCLIYVKATFQFFHSNPALISVIIVLDYPLVRQLLFND